MGSIYRPRYRNAAGELVVQSVWWLKFYANGKPVRLNSRTDKEGKARQLLKLKEGDAVRGLPVMPKVNRKTVADLLDDVINDYKANEQRSLDAAERRIRKHLTPYFGTWNAASVTDDQVRAYINERRAAGASSATVNRELSLLKRGYTLNQRTVTVRPDIPHLKEANARKGFFERAQYDAVHAALPCELRPLLTVAYITGWRIKSELLPLEWRQVDFKARTLRLEPNTTKNGEGREFPFTESLEAALRDQWAYTERVSRDRGMVCRWVFHRDGERVRYWRRQWLKALRAVGLARIEGEGSAKKIIPVLIPHDLRRTAIRNLARAGVSEAVAMKMCGHETRSVFDRYNIVTGDDLRAAAAKLDADTVTGTVAGTVAALEAISGTATKAKSPKS